MSRFLVNDFPHMSQWWFFIPVCVTMCRDKSPEVRNPLLQTGQIWSRIPVWIFLCAWKFPSAANCFEQISHCNGRSPVCVLKIDRKISSCVDKKVSKLTECELPNCASEQIVSCMCCTDKWMAFRRCAFGYESVAEPDFEMFCGIHSMCVVLWLVVSVHAFFALPEVFSCNDFDIYSSSVLWLLPHHHHQSSWNRLRLYWFHYLSFRSLCPECSNMNAIADQSFRIAAWSDTQHPIDIYSYCKSPVAFRHFCKPKKNEFIEVMVNLSHFEWTHLNFSTKHHHFGWHHCKFSVKNRCQHIFLQANAANFIDIYVVVHVSDDFHSKSTVFESI